MITNVDGSHDTTPASRPRSTRRRRTSFAVFTTVTALAAILTSGIGSAAAQPGARHIAASFSAADGQIYSARSTHSLGDAMDRVMRDCGPSCPEPRAATDACIALAIGRDGNWGSDWAFSIPEAESKAIRTAETLYHARGPFHLWSACA